LAFSCLVKLTFTLHIDAIYNYDLCLNDNITIYIKVNKITRNVNNIIDNAHKNVIFSNSLTNERNNFDYQLNYLVWFLLIISMLNLFVYLKF